MLTATRSCRRHQGSESAALPLLSQNTQANFSEKTDKFSFEIIITLGEELPGAIVYPEAEELYNASSAVKMHRPCALSERLMLA